MGVAAAQLDWPIRGLTGRTTRHPERSGVVFGADYMLTLPEEFTAGVRSCGDPAGQFDYSRWATDGMAQMQPLWLLKYLPNMPASHIAIYNDLRAKYSMTQLREEPGDRRGVPTTSGTNLWRDGTAGAPDEDGARVADRAAGAKTSAILARHLDRSHLQPHGMVLGALRVRTRTTRHGPGPRCNDPRRDRRGGSSSVVDRNDGQVRPDARQCFSAGAAPTYRCRGRSGGPHPRPRDAH